MIWEVFLAFAIDNYDIFIDRETLVDNVRSSHQLDLSCHYRFTHRTEINGRLSFNNTFDVLSNFLEDIAPKLTFSDWLEIEQLITYSSEDYYPNGDKYKLFAFVRRITLWDLFKKLKQLGHI